MSNSDSCNVVDIACKVLRTEAEAIMNLIAQLDAGFEDAVDIALSTEGRLVVLGVGKSGHIGKKLAATLASTGTPAFFVHGTEAVHGDLGMITSSDVVIMISYSGETEEILKVIPTVKTLGARIIAFTGNKDSTLAKASDAVIRCSVDREADPLNLAPSASSTATLAMGDAFAITLMSLKGFSAPDFYVFHPGGSLGKGLEKTLSE